MNVLILLVVLLVCGSQVVLQFIRKNYEASVAWVAALALGVALALSLMCLDRLMPS